MNKTAFKFQNQEYCQSSQKKEPLSEKSIKKLLAVSSFLAFFSLLALKSLYSLNFNKQTSDVAFRKSFSPKDTFKTAQVFPLLVNLKGKKGPQLARIYVSITLNENSLEKEFLSQGNKLEKHLLFILSGQSVDNLSKKKNHFEKQIRSQLNAFLTENLIDGVRIRTEKLN